MATVGRLAGGIVVQTGDDYFLVGNLKEPCKWEEVGFTNPGEIDAVARPYLALETCGEFTFSGTVLMLNLEGEAAARRIADFFLIRRNGSVSKRLWDLVTSEDDEELSLRVITATWLDTLPPRVWEAVRETVLSCS